MTHQLVVMISGSGRTLLNLQDLIERGELDARIVRVIASRQCVGAQLARKRGLGVDVRTGDLERDELGVILDSLGADWVVLAGYLRRCPIPEGYEGRVVNIHPALLPKFGGKGMHGTRVHEAVLEGGEDESGCTVHLCDDQYDSGPIVAQARCPVQPDDTPESLAERVFKLELELYPRALSELMQDHPRLAR
ncbi:MAG: phosphoribosylglycinamide formyltransferase [Planctomycetota bacterium]